MPDFKVTFKGDLGNLAQFDAAVRNSALSSAKAIESANRNIASAAGRIGIDKGQAGQFVRNNKSIVDSFNNTFRHSGDVFRRYVADYEVAVNKVGKAVIKPIFDEAYDSSFKKNIGNVKAYNQALLDLAPTNKKLAANSRIFALQQADIFNQRAPLRAQRGILEKSLGEADTKGTIPELIRQAKAGLAEFEDAYTAKPLKQTQTKIGRAKREITELQDALAKKKAPIIQSMGEIDEALNKLNRREVAAQNYFQQRRATLRQDPGFARLDAAQRATPPINTNLASVLQESEELRRRLIQGGLGKGARYKTEDFQKALAEQDASVGKITRNLRTGVRTVQGEFLDLKGTLNNFTVDLDDNGKVVGRWGGQLSGAGSILRQTVRDFQKVIEWTVATTVVFGSLAAVFTQFQSINELNNSLARFAITAQTSAQETQLIFKDLAQVAFDTATPLNEIVTVADDIALATRVAGQSTDEWRKDILELTTAVGIFTNLTGVETVQAADQLSSAFKQLGIAPSEVVGVLNKVTAVAGGQANAIADIVKALATVSEASRAAGLSVDEQIASVQVLSQVTNKSAADIATAFKNLFGSVSSVGSEKILKEFGIQIRDETGGIRDFLDIYREVADALESGIIPQNRLPDVLRGISGGPRRAPDAAALLSNLGRIDEVVARSAGATNEALIANAAILDTNQAKITRFQNSINTAVFERFGQAVSDLVGFLTDLGTTFASVFNGISPELVNIALKLGIVVGGLRLLGGLGKLVFGGVLGGAIGTLKNLGVALRDAGKYARIAGTDMAAFETHAGTVFGPTLPAATGVKSRLTNLIGNNRGKILGAGLIAGGAAVAGQQEGIDSNTLGTLLQLGGAIATLIPGLQGVGIAAIAAGTGIQLFGNNAEKTRQTAAELSEEVYNLTKNVQASQEEANQFARQQSAALQIMDELQAKTNKTGEEQARLSAATTDFVTATLGLAAANREVANTFDELTAKIPGLADAYGSFKDAVNRGVFEENDPLLKKLQQQLAADILKGSGQGVFAGPDIPSTGQFRPRVEGSTQFRLEPNRTIDLSELITNPDLLKQIFRVDRGANSLSFGKPVSFEGNNLQSDASLRLIQGALSQLLQDFQSGKGNVTEEQINALVQAVAELSKTASSFSQNSVALAQQNAAIQAKIVTGQFTGGRAQNATTSNTLASQLNNALGTGANFPAGVATQVTGTIQELFDKAATGAALTNAELRSVGETLLFLEGTFGTLKEQGEAALNEGIVQRLREAGVSAEALDSIMRSLGVSTAAAAAPVADLSATLEAARQKAAEAFGERQLQLQIADNSGQFEKNAAGLANLRAQSEAAYQSTLQLIDSTTALSGTAFVDLNNALSQVVGLQGIYIGQTELSTLANDINEDGVSALQERQAGLGQLLIENAIKAGVNAEGIQKITLEVAKLNAAIAFIPPYKQVIIDVTTRLNTIDASGGGERQDIARGSGRLAQLRKQYEAALKKQKEAEKAGTDPTSAINKILKEINKIISQGTGSSFGSLPSGGSTASKAAKAAAIYNKPGLLDVPEEILQQTNYSALIQKAIQNAKNLQKQIPGETKANKGEIVELLNGTKRILETRGIGEEYLRRALDELTGEIKKQNDLLTKADTIRRIRVGAGDFSSIANVPFNSRSGVSVGSPQGPISVSLNLNGTVLTPAQFAQFADLVAASIKRQIAL